MCCSKGHPGRNREGGLKVQIVLKWVQRKDAQVQIVPKRVQGEDVMVQSDHRRVKKEDVLVRRASRRVSEGPKQPHEDIGRGYEVQGVPSRIQEECVRV